MAVLSAQTDFGTRRPALIALFVVSAAGLIFEITLTRLFSLFFQYHFTFLAVSLAVLGLSLGAASAQYLSAARVRSAGTIAALLIAVSVSLSAAAAIIAWLPSVESIFPRALVALVPFFFVGLFDALVFENFAADSGTFYAADLIGAALGVGVVLALLSLWSAFSMTLFLAALIGACALFFVWQARRGRDKINGVSLKPGDPGSPKSAFLPSPRVRNPTVGWTRAVGGEGHLVTLFAAGSFGLGVALLLANLVSGVVDFNPLALIGFPRDKTMIAILQDPNQLARILYTGWSPFARVDVVQTGDHSSRYIFADGGAGSYMLPYDGDPASLAALANTMEYLPFTSGSAEKTLVIGAGGGKDILLALQAGAQAITAVEVNPAIIAATRTFADYNGGVLDLPQVDLVEGDARSFVERTDDKYDLIYLNLVYTQAVEPAGQALVENYIFTRQAFGTYLDRLTPGGRLTLVAHNGVEGSRAMLTVLQALEDAGIPPSQALDHLWLWKAGGSDQTVATTVLVVGKDPLPAATVTALNADAQALGMTPLFAPGDYETLFVPLRSGTSLSTYIQADAAYNLGPTDDDQPYFYNLEYGIPPAIRSSLVLAGLLALVLLGLGLSTGWRGTLAQIGWPMLAYAVLIGLGFMLVEIPLIQRFSLLLGQPILSLAVVLATLLLSSGLGSLISQRWSEAKLSVRVAVAGLWIAAVTALYWVALPALVDALLVTPFAVRLLAIVLLTALLGVPMGMPFPSLLRLAGEGRQQIALLWAINGAFSVLGSTLAMVVSMRWGFKWALIAGAGAYLALAVMVWWWLRVRSPEGLRVQ